MNPSDPLNLPQQQPDIPQPQPPQAFVPSYGDPLPTAPPQVATPQQHFNPMVQPAQPIAPEAYSFIVNPEKSRKALFIHPGSMKQRLALAAGGLVVLLIAGLTISSLLSGSGSSPTVAYQQVALQQQELVHLSDPNSVNNQQNVSADTANTLATINLSTASAQSQLFTYTSKNGFKLKISLIQANYSQTTDAALANAQSAGNYEATLLSTLQAQLSSYGRALKTAYLSTKGPKGRALLNSDYQQQQAILSKLASTSPGTN